jgi:hypothetical protein
MGQHDSQARGHQAAKDEYQHPFVQPAQLDQQTGLCLLSLAPPPVEQSASLPGRHRA